MNVSGFEIAIPFLFIIFFVSLWVFVLWILSFISGWRTLARHYHYAGSFHGESAKYESARLRGVNFRSVLEVGVGDQGLYLVPLFLFRPFHKPLLIPWDEIGAEPFNRLFFKGHRLAFRSSPGIKLQLYSRTYDRMRPYLKSHS